MSLLSGADGRGRQILYDLLQQQGSSLGRPLERFAELLLQPPDQFRDIGPAVHQLRSEKQTGNSSPRLFDKSGHKLQVAAPAERETEPDSRPSRQQRRRGKQRESYLLKPQSRTLGVEQVAGLTPEQAYRQLCKLRWPETKGQPVCPSCGCYSCYAIKSPRRYKCSACWKFFSLTSGTIFHGRKLSYRKLLLAFFFFANGVKGMPALELARTLNISPKSAFVLLHKIRESIEAARRNVVLEGVVEIDGAYFGGYFRPPNEGRDGKRSPDKPDAKPKRRCIVAMVERRGAAVPMVANFETQAVAIEAARRHIRPGSTISADEHASYDALHAKYKMFRINHSVAYADGLASTNEAESFHSRTRRAEIGQYHHISGCYLGRYAHEIAYRHSRRRVDNGSIYRELIELAIGHPVSREWKGYWQKRASVSSEQSD